MKQTKASIKSESEIVMSKAEFEKAFPVGHMRRAVSKGYFSLNGYYTFLDPSTGKKTFVE